MVDSMLLQKVKITFPEVLTVSLIRRKKAKKALLIHHSVGTGSFLKVTFLTPMYINWLVGTFQCDEGPWVGQARPMWDTAMIVVSKKREKLHQELIFSRTSNF